MCLVIKKLNYKIAQSDLECYKVVAFTICSSKYESLFKDRSSYSFWWDKTLDSKISYDNDFITMCYTPIYHLPLLPGKIIPEYNSDQINCNYSNSLRGLLPFSYTVGKGFIHSFKTKTGAISNFTTYKKIFESFEDAKKYCISRYLKILSEPESRKYGVEDNLADNKIINFQCVIKCTIPKDTKYFESRSEIASKVIIIPK